MAGYWDQLVDAVIRPPRDSYHESDLVGGSRANFSIGATRYYRQDMTVRLQRGGWLDRGRGAGGMGGREPGTGVVANELRRRAVRAGCTGRSREKAARARGDSSLDSNPRMRIPPPWVRQCRPARTTLHARTGVFRTALIMSNHLPSAFVFRPTLRAVFSPARKLDACHSPPVRCASPLRAQLLNKYNQRLAVSHYRPCVVVSPDGRLPAIVYVHANSGSRQDAEEILEHVLPLHFTVLAIDCAGSGLSEGKHVTLGAREQDDVETAVRYLESQGSSSHIVLWGRSQGAVASALLASRGAASGVDAIVVDSPFSRLRDLMMEIAESTPFRAARPIMGVALALMRRSVRRRAGFDVNLVAPIDMVSHASVPALFCHADMDSFVGCHHSKLLQQAYGGKSELLLLEGDHNSVRPLWWYEAACAFLLDTLNWNEMSKRVTPAVLDSPAPPPLTNRHRGLNPPWSPEAISSMRRPVTELGKPAARPNDGVNGDGNAAGTGRGASMRPSAPAQISKGSSRTSRPASPSRSRPETVLAALAGGPPPRELSATLCSSSASMQGPHDSPLRAAAMRRARSDTAVGSAPSSPPTLPRHASSASSPTSAEVRQPSALASPTRSRPGTAPTLTKASVGAVAASASEPVMQRPSPQKATFSRNPPPSSLTSPSAWMSAPMSSSPKAARSATEAASAASASRTSGESPAHSRSSSFGSPHLGPGPPRRPGARPSCPVPASAGGWLHSNATNGWGMPTAHSASAHTTPLQRPSVPGKDGVKKAAATVVEVVEVVEEPASNLSGDPKPDFDASAAPALGGPAPVLAITAGESTNGAFGVTVVEVEVPTSASAYEDQGMLLEEELLGVTIAEPDSP